MRFQIYFTVLVLLFPAIAFAQQITIADARSQPVGSVVTVSGIVTSGPEFGTIRYIQDGTGGIALFSSALASLQRGDDVTVTGTTIEFQNLLEISNVTNWSVNSNGNSLPAPLILSPSQLNETNESMLVRINNATFIASGNFQSNTTYSFTSNGENGVVFIRSSNPLVGQPIPNGSILLYGVNSQYGNVYQVLPRDANDLVNASTIYITNQPTPVNITTSGFDVQWETSVPGNAYVSYGLTPSLELGTLPGPPNTSNPSVNISGIAASQVVYCRTYSISGSDTALSPVIPFITASNSSGQIKAYFNRPVNTAVASPPSNTAVYLNEAFDDTLKAYIDRSVSTLDIAIYNMDNNGGALIAQAINDAKNRGVRVRIVTDGGNTNSGLLLLDPTIPVLLSPSLAFYYGIMHHKFFIADGDHPDPLRSIVMTGSTNWTNTQLKNDRNNLLFIQDQSLAKVYTMEFEEMWGGSGNQPDTTLSKFGPDKADNTPHILSIGGKKVESYFSPSDNVNNQIIRSIGTADSEINCATMVLTRTDLAYAIEERVVNHGVYGSVIINDSAGSGASYLILQSAIGANMLEFTQPHIMHHKYMIVDQGNLSSDPFVLTGSHNWSTAATQRNDENTIIIHDPLIVNQYYQEFHDMFNSNGGALGADELEANTTTISLFPNPAVNHFTIAVNGMIGKNASIELLNIHGQHVSTIFSGIIVNEIIEINSSIENLPGGIYFVKLYSYSDIKVMRLIKTVE